MRLGYASLHRTVTRCRPLALCGLRSRGQPARTQCVTYVILVFRYQRQNFSHRMDAVVGEQSLNFRPRDLVLGFANFALAAWAKLCTLGGQHQLEVGGFGRLGCLSACFAAIWGCAAASWAATLGVAGCWTALALGLRDLGVVLVLVMVMVLLLVVGARRYCLAQKQLYRAT